MNRDLKNALIIGGIIVGLFIVLTTVWGGLAGWQWGDGMWGSGMMGIGILGGLLGVGLMAIFCIAIVALVIWGIVAFIRSVASSGAGGRQEACALEILKRRYARGEINKEEFEEKKKDLL